MILIDYQVDNKQHEKQFVTLDIMFLNLNSVLYMHLFIR